MILLAEPLEAELDPEGPEPAPAHVLRTAEARGPAVAVRHETVAEAGVLELAATLIDVGRPGEALLQLRRASAGGASPRIRHLMGRAHLLTGDAQVAVEELLAAARELPDDARLRCDLAAAFEALLDDTPVAAAEHDAQEGDVASRDGGPADHAPVAGLPPSFFAWYRTLLTPPSTALTPDHLAELSAA